MEDDILSPREVLESFENKFIEALQKSLEKHDKVSAGGLWQSIKAETKVYGQSMVLEISMDDYWKWVESGRKAGSKQPPIAPILKFIANRGITPKLIKQNKGLKKKDRKVISKDAQYRSLAFLIARGIKKHGIKPTHFASEVMHGSLTAEFTKELSQSVGRQIKIQIESVVDIK